MITSQSIQKIAPALLAAQKAIVSAVKDAKNPYFKSAYADLTTVIEAVKGPLNAAGITFLQAIGWDNDRPVVETLLLHESGEFMSTTTPVFTVKEKDPQAFGSGVSYTKRYALQALLGVPTEDDDGESTIDRKKNGPAMPTKPEINLTGLKSESGLAYLRKFTDAATALAEIGNTKTMTAEAVTFIKSVFAEPPK